MDLHDQSNLDLSHDYEKKIIITKKKKLLIIKSK